MAFEKLRMIAAVALIGIGGTASAATTLGVGIQCSAGNALNGIAVTDVTGNAGGATDCWGTLDGNDPGPSGSGFEIDGMNYGFIAKQDIDDGLSGLDIGLVVGGAPSQSGTWSFSGLPANLGDFIIVLKAASSPGFAAWLFSGDPDATSTSGLWNVAWGKDLSHLAIYAKISTVPLPAGGLLLIGALGGLGLLRRRRKNTA